MIHYQQSVSIIDNVSAIEMYVGFRNVLPQNYVLMRFRYGFSQLILWSVCVFMVGLIDNNEIKH